MDKQLDELEQELGKIYANTIYREGFERMQEIMHQIAVLKGWHSPSKSFGEAVVMMHSELSESIEAYRTEDGDATKIWYVHQYVPSDSGMSITQDGPTKPEGVPIEFADLFIRLLDTCGLYDINLLSATIQKSIYNLKRPHRHGNKKI